MSARAKRKTAAPQVPSRRARKTRNPSELLIFGNPSKLRVVQDAGTKKFTASLQDSEFGNTYATAATKAEAVKALRARIRGMRAAVSRSKNPKKSKLELAQRAWMKTKGHVHQFGVKNCPACHPSLRPTQQKQVNTRRRNPSESEQAVKLFESFHGRDAQEVIEAQRSAAMRLDYAACGPLVALGFDDCGFPESRLKDKWDQCSHIDFEGDKVMLASAPNGKQLYFIGGNQNLDGQLSSFENVDTEKDLIDLGPVAFVVYEARKVHDNFEPADYCHRFGDPSTEIALDESLPRLAYDKVKKEMLLVGGDYHIDSKHGVSPGIEG